MRTIILILLTMTACADQPPQTAETSQAALYCTDGGGRISCWPNDPFENWRCDSLCNSSGFVDGYCPSYTSAEYSFCVQHCFDRPDMCDYNCQPIMAHQCVAGHQL